MHDWYRCDMYCLSGIEEVGAWSGKVALNLRPCLETNLSRAAKNALVVSDETSSK